MRGKLKKIQINQIGLRSQIEEIVKINLADLKVGGVNGLGVTKVKPKRKM